MPNSRSSHTIPTPRGGGAAIVLAFVCGLTICVHLFERDGQILRALLPGGLLVAAVGFWDDHAPLPAVLRLFLHFLAAICTVAYLGGWPVLDLGFTRCHWGWAGSGIAVIGVVWTINLYNFMDGIDGLAGLQAVFMGVAGGAVMLLSGADGLPLWLFAASAMGFLLLNWPPARIFMGDAGSGFLGYGIAVLALQATTAGHTMIWSWAILIGIFAADATLTLCRRAWSGFRVMDAHRTHAYQWAARRVRSHLTVTLSAAAINLLILLPAALATLIWPLWAVPITLACYSGLFALAWVLGAGRPESARERLTAG